MGASKFLSGAAKAGSKAGKNLGKGAKTAGKGLKSGAKAAGGAAKQAGSKAKAAGTKVTNKIDDALGVKPGKIDPKTGKEVSKMSQRGKKLGKAADKASDAYDVYTTVNDMMSGGTGVTENTDGGDGRPTGAPPQRPTAQEPQQPKPRPNGFQTDERLKEAANIVKDEQAGGSSVSYDSYMAALSTVNRYEQSACKKKPAGGSGGRNHF